MKNSLALLGLLTLMACSGSVDPIDDKGGPTLASSTGGTETRVSEGEAGGSRADASTGGTMVSDSGGSPPVAAGGSGGKPPESHSGGAEPATGGAEPATGGTAEPATGGTAEPATGGNPPATGGAETGGEPATGGAPVCVPDATLCNSTCGTISDGCDGELDCGACQPTPVSSNYGNVCEYNVCVMSDPLPAPDAPLPEYDAACLAEHGAQYGQAWRGWGSGTSCKTLTGSDVNCCEPSSPCTERAVTGCTRKFFNCPTAPWASCEQLTYQGRLKNEWCCD